MYREQVLTNREPTTSDHLSAFPGFSRLQEAMPLDVVIRTSESLNLSGQMTTSLVCEAG